MRANLELAVRPPSMATDKTIKKTTLLPERRRQVSLGALPQLVHPGELVYIPGSSGAPLAFVSELLREPDFTRDVRILSTYVPGINQFDMRGLHSTAQITGLFMQPSLAEAQRCGQYRALPMSYAGFVRHLLDHVNIDLAVVQVSAPDADGRCSMGPAVEFMPAALSKSRRRLALINRQTPCVRGSVKLALDSFDYVCEVDSALPVYDVPADTATESIARHIAPLIEDGSVLQTGLGKVPTALMRLLRDRRKLRLHSGMLSDGLLDLAEAGALDMSFTHSTCVLVGSSGFYERVRDFMPLRVRGCEITHNPQVLMGLDRFVSVNSALEVDLFGQCNLEHANGASVSGAGGAPDFARAGRLSEGGCSIVALHAQHKRGSRIIPSLSDQAVASLSRVDVDYVVTEFGVARLNGASVHERAEAIITVAAPEFRAELQEAWRAIAIRL